MGEKPTEADETAEKKAPLKQEEDRAEGGGGGEGERFLKIEAERAAASDTFIKMAREADPGGGAAGIAVSEPGAPADNLGTNLNSSKSNLQRQAAQEGGGDQPGGGAAGIAVGDEGAPADKDKPKK
jgi:hypothetical protein